MRRVIILVLMLVLSIVWTVPAIASKLSEAQNDKKEVEKKINSINEQKQQAAQDLKKAKADASKLDGSIRETDSSYQDLQEEIKAIEGQINAIENEIKECEDDYNNQLQLFKTRLKVMYENSNKSMLDILVESRSITDFFERFEYISLVSKKDKQLAIALEEAKKDVEYKKSLKEKQKQKQQMLAADTKKRIDSLLVSRSMKSSEIRKLTNNISLLESQENELEKKAQELISVINKLTSTTSRFSGEAFKWPVPSSVQISSYYGMRVHPIFKSRKMHYGIDINAQRGSSIIAAAGGKVIFAGWQSGYGNTVIIDHGSSISTVYAHCSRILVGTGDHVNKGDLIAKVGSTGWSTGPHLHFEVRVNGATKDPLTYASGK